jgi:DNA-binding Lrp family transcriptional regulator
MLSELDKKLLMILQYEFPLDPRPFEIIAEKVGISEDEVINKIKGFLSNSIIKRIGMYVSFRAKGMESALVASSIPLEYLEVYRRKALSIKELTHNYVRNHPRFNVWFVIKAENKELLNKKIEDLLISVNCTDYVILYSKKTLKLSVKYDIIRGISWSEREEVIDNVPTIEELGLPKALIDKLSYPLQITKHPFKKISEEFKMSEEELLEIIKELKIKHVIKDYGATLNGEAIGITENAMVLLNGNNIEEICEEVASRVPEATHVVLREYNKKWDYLCYFMIHGSDKKKLREVAKKAVEITNSNSYMMLFSLENLKPGIVI